MVSDTLEQLSQVWEWAVEQVTIAAGAALGFDPTTVVPWAQLIAALLAIVLTSFGLLNLWQRIGSQRRKLLVDYLSTEEKRLDEKRTDIARRLQVPRKRNEKLEPMNVDAALETAIRYHEAGKFRKAEAMLERLYTAVDDRKTIAGRQAEVAKLQVAAIHLFRGSMLASQCKPLDAIRQFEEALSEVPNDFEARRYIVEQYLKLVSLNPVLRVGYLQSANNALSEFTKRAAADPLRVVEGKMLQGLIYEAQVSLGNAHQTLVSAAEEAKITSDQLLIAQVNEHLGRVCEYPNLEYWKVAKEAYQSAAAAFQKLDRIEDQDRMIQCFQRVSERQAAQSKSAASRQLSIPIAMPPPVKDPKLS